jgi:hypothetical protein
LLKQDCFEKPEVKAPDASDLDDALIAPGRPGIYEKPLLLLLNSFNYLWFLSWYNVANFYGERLGISAAIGLAILMASSVLTWVAMYLNHRAFLLYSVSVLHGHHTDVDDEDDGDDRMMIIRAGLALKGRATRTGLTDRSIAQLFSASTFVAILILNSSLQEYLNKQEDPPLPASPAPTPVAAGLTAAPTGAPTAPQGGLTDPGNHGWRFWQWSLYLSLWVIFVLVVCFRLLDLVKASHSATSVHTRSAAVIISTIVNLGSYLAALAINVGLHTAAHCCTLLHTAACFS